MAAGRSRRKKRFLTDCSDAAGVVRALRNDSRYGEGIAHHEYMPAIEARYSDLEKPLHPALKKALGLIGLGKLYCHQARAIDSVRRGEDVVVCTPTASGKTLIYNLPVVESALGQPGSRALYLFPLKALEQDQKRKIDELTGLLSGEREIRAEIYDGDTSAYCRRKIAADPPDILLTNPDMLHMSMLAYHEKWEDFFANLRFVVVDELHTYKGIFGAHFAGVVRRLLRVAGHYGARPGIIASSATVGNPGQFARKLFEREFTVVSESGAPAAGRHFVFVNPPDVRPATLASRLLRDLVAAGLKTIAFTKSRRNTELIHSWVVDAEPGLACRVTSYRSGYMPSERRIIEQSLASDRLDAVVSTSALEMGIDIGGLDACILVGYPGTVTQTWQRGGRVGRSDRESIVIMVAQQDALDQYFMRHPENFFARTCESALVDPENPFILADHVECMAAELPLAQRELADAPQALREAVESLKAAGRLLESMRDSRLYSARRYPQREVSLRQTGESFTILDDSAGRPERVGSVGGSRALAECHTGAVYLHRARQYVVTRLDLGKRNIYVRPSRDPYYTQVTTEKQTEILEQLKSRPAGNFLVKYGRLRVTETITGFQKRSIGSQELLSTHPLELPPQVFETTGFWIEVPAGVREAVEQEEGHFMGGLHSVEHAVIAIFPLFVLCDRNDIGGICFTIHAQVGGPAIFIYDGYPGGVGIARGGFERIEELLAATHRLIEECDCEEGCPSCVHSPKCGSGNKPLDKRSALIVLELLLGRRSLPEPAEAGEPSAVRAPGREKPEDVGGLYPPERRIYVFDLETQRSADEVGGWRNKHLMRVSVAVVQDVVTGEVLTFLEHDVEGLVELLSRADLVVGFNIRDFDYSVLRAYTDSDFDSWKTFDILEDIHSRLGHRLSLDSVATATLGAAKTADGLMAIKWFREGKLEKIIDYCASDVYITRRLFEHGLREHFLVYDHRRAGRVKLPVDWEINSLLAGSRFESPP